ncbi:MULTISPECIES: hypothetical protein [unclassified Endozoicomonas]|uniref:hypothetical protein n=1 Tax=unclassified Endozoicomonas TaxID=2644528 RepID=UPI0021484E6D|nr:MULTISPECIES: hypothetical protein [unclassified Endozoicomonas]
MINFLQTGSVPFDKNAITDKLEKLGNLASSFRRSTVRAFNNVCGYMKTAGDFSHTHYSDQSSRSSGSAKQVSERAIARPPSERGITRPVSKPGQPESQNDNNLAARLESLKIDCSRAHTKQDLVTMKQKTTGLLDDAKTKLQNHPEAGKVLEKLNVAVNLLETSSEDENHVHEAADYLQKVLLDVRFDELSQLRQRNDQIMKIERDVADVHEIMHNLQGIVHEQGQDVSRIEDHITQSRDNVEEAVESLDSAKKSAKKGRKLKIFLGIVLAVVGITLLACLL